MSNPILDGMMCGRRPRLMRAWLMARATLWYSWGAPLPDDERGGFWFAVGAAWENFVGELVRGKG